jgi:hypothetical protein
MGFLFLQENDCLLEYKLRQEKTLNPKNELRVLKWYLQGSNQGHMDFQSIALPSELRYHPFKRVQI